MKACPYYEKCPHAEQYSGMCNPENNGNPIYEGCPTYERFKKEEQ